ncbi:hypothetical protein GQ600_2048 [Phytophthora cactorum]|nr:hypothetical protein GQ600_2048 [Phytophthora cactorum]
MQHALAAVALCPVHASHPAALYRTVFSCRGALHWCRRFESSESTPSRFLSLADEEKAKNEDGEEGEGAEDEGDGAQDEDSEGQDRGRWEENEELDELVMELFMENCDGTPRRWQATSHGSRAEEFRAKEEAKEKAQKEMDDQAKKLVDAEAAGNDTARLKRSMIMGIDDEAFRLLDGRRTSHTKKKHLLVRDESRTLRLATNEEVLPRTWVRRPAHFRGLDKELA